MSDRSSLGWWAGAAVAVFCVGSCVGNVFVMRRFSTRLHPRAPPPDARAGRASTQAPPTHTPPPRGLVDALLLLGLSPSELPSRARLQSAYRAEALRSHPDRLARDDPARATKVRRFEAATDAYQRLRKHVKN